MTPRSLGITGLCLATMAAAIGAAPFQAPSRDAAAPANSTSLNWTADVVSYTGGDWDGAVQAAAACTEGGLTDWRLPTPAELQDAVQNGSWGACHHLSASGRGWTSKTQGKNSAYAVKIVTDANGEPDGSLSGQIQKVLKGSNFSSTKFVRP